MPHNKHNREKKRKENACVRRVNISADLLMPVLCSLLEEGKDVSLTVTGYSMQPFFRHGRDSVLVSPPKGVPCRGEIVLIRDVAGRYILHRVLDVADGIIYTCGDGNRRPDPPMSVSGLCGVVHSAKRKGKVITDKSFYWKLHARIWGVHPFARRPFLMIYQRLAFGLDKLKKKDEDEDTFGYDR